MLIFKKTVNFLSVRRITTTLSIVLIIFSLVSIISKGLNPGIDFTGGFQVEVSYEQSPEIESIRNNLSAAGFNDAIVQNSGSATDIMIRIAPREGLDSRTVGKLIIDNLNQSSNSAQLMSSEYVSAQVGEELTEQGGLAMIFALIMIMIYIVFRFQWKFSIGAVMALIHDVLITIGVFSIFQITFDLAVLAAILAVVGYSLNDTIVIFDRIRENFRSMRRAETLDILNSSITQTISRTMITSSTTLMVLLALYIMGGQSLQGFSLALIIGVLIGTYSSIFIASTSIFYLDISTSDLLSTKREEVDDGMP
jgi:preprotein translocase subunit SecF